MGNATLRRMNRSRLNRVNGGIAKNFLPLAAAGYLLATGLTGCLHGGGKTADGPGSSAATADVNAPVKPEFRYKVAAETTDFFLISPQQAAGPDDHLKKDARVTLVKRYGGYSQIKTAGGLTGYVPSDEITRLSPQEISQEDAALLAKQAPAAALGPIPGGPGAAYSIPSEATRETVLPVPDAPTPTPNPMFRY